MPLNRLYERAKEIKAHLGALPACCAIVALVGDDEPLLVEDALWAEMRSLADTTLFAHTKPLTPNQTILSKTKTKLAQKTAPEPHTNHTLHTKRHTKLHASNNGHTPHQK
jgi:hypothetical protein